MLVILYKKLSPYLCGLLLLISIVLTVMLVYRGEQLRSLQNHLLTSKDKQVEVIIKQQDIATKIGDQYEQSKAAKEKEKIYVDREVEKIVLMSSYSNECFDTSGLQSLNSYIAQTNSAIELSGTKPTTGGAD